MMVEIVALAVSPPPLQWCLPLHHECHRRPQRLLGPRHRRRLHLPALGHHLSGRLRLRRRHRLRRATAITSATFTSAITSTALAASFASSALVTSITATSLAA